MSDLSPRRDFAGRQVGHFRVVERIAEPSGSKRGEDRWRCLCDVCGEWREMGTSALVRAETRERCLGVKAQCRRCSQQEKRHSARNRPRWTELPPDRAQAPAERRDIPAVVSDQGLAVAIAELIPLDFSFDEEGWPCQGLNGASATRFDPANDWNHALLALRRLLGENGESSCQSFYRDLEFVLAGSTSILPDWPRAFGLLITQGPRSVCAAILRCCPVPDRSPSLVRS